MKTHAAEARVNRREWTPSLPHRRSPEKAIYRACIRYVLENKYEDHELAETVNLTSQAKLRSYAVTYKKEKLMEGPIRLDVVTPKIVLGEVLTDNRGRGSLQK